MPIPLLDDIDLARRTILRRVPFDEIGTDDATLDRNARIFGARVSPAQAVEQILQDVRARGDAALRDWTERLDGVRLERFEVDADQLARAAAAIEPDLLAALQLAAGEIERFHRHQTRTSWIDFGPEGALGQLVVPLQRVGLYVPGGSAPLPSSLLMAALPARLSRPRAEELIPW